MIDIISKEEPHDDVGESITTYSSVVLLAVYHKTGQVVCSWQNVLTGPAVNETNFISAVSIFCQAAD